MKINHDDDLLKVIDRVNAELLPRNLKFVDDEREYDGFCIYSLEEIKKETT